MNSANNTAAKTDYTADLAQLEEDFAAGRIDQVELRYWEAKIEALEAERG